MAVGVGIELAPGAVRAALLDSSGSQVKLLAAHEAACDTASSEALTGALAQIHRTLRLSSSVIIGIPSTSAILATVSPLVVNPRRARLAVQFEMQQQVPFELSQASWHYQWLSSNGQATPSRSAAARVSSAPAIVAAVRRTVLDDRVAACRRAGFAVHAVAASPVALLNVWRAVGSNARATHAMLLHLLDGQTAEWIIWSPTALQVVPVAGSSPALFVEELAASWESVRSQTPESVSRVVVIGESRSPGVIEMLTRLGLQGEPLELAGTIKSGGAQAKPAEQVAVACGLALQGLGLARHPLNLLAASQEQAQSDRMRHRAMAVTGLCAVAAIGFGVTGMLEARSRRTRVLELLERKEQLYQTLRPEVRELIQRQQDLERRTLQVERLARNGPFITGLLAKVAEALPDDAWLTSAAYSKTGALVEGMLEGRARSFQDVTKFFDQLKAVAGMTTVKPLSTSVTTDPETGKELIAFSVQVQRPVEPQHATSDTSQ